VGGWYVVQAGHWPGPRGLLPADTKLRRKSRRNRAISFRLGVGHPNMRLLGGATGGRRMKRPRTRRGEYVGNTRRRPSKLSSLRNARRSLDCPQIHIEKLI